MKKNLFFTFLTVSILSLNVLPIMAVESVSINSNLETLDTKESTDSDYSAIADGQWCVRIPAMGIFCWDL